MLIYKTSQFEDLEQEYGLGEHVASVAERIENAKTRAEIRNLFDVLGRYFKDRHEKLRLIGRLREVDGHPVFCWVNIFKRDSPQYATFKDLDESQVERGFSISEVRAFVRQKQKEASLQSALPPLPDSLYGWLSPLSDAIAHKHEVNDIKIYESVEWVDRVLDLRESIFMLHKLLGDLIQDIEAGREPTSSDSWKVRHTESSREAIFYTWVGPKEILLLTATDNFARGIDEKNSRTLRLMGEKGPKVWRRLARRAYPGWVVVDREAWREIQVQDAASLALSTEESAILDEVAGHGVDRATVPLFINGQAGSGKSTVLAYLFAGLCRVKKRQGLDGHPLYLTYSRDLVDRARNFSGRLLNAVESDVTPPDGFDDWFVSWRQYLRGLLNADLQTRFPDRDRVDFHSFKRAWAGGRGVLPPFQGVKRPDLSAEVAWYAIRSIIKGSGDVDADGLIRPVGIDDYAELSRRDRVIDDAMFGRIFNDIYRSWYAPALTEGRLWDDQDLVAEVIKQGPVLDDDVITALVIDEAQDFTNRELRLVARLCGITNFSVPPDFSTISLPIIFAGDPLQTLSPTGFRWESVQAGIREELEALIGDRAARPELKVLKNNYRSSSPIVRFANSIQLRRRNRFKLEWTGAQFPWNPFTTDTPPQKVIIGETAGVETVAEFLAKSNMIIVVPCEEGGEQEFIAADPLLSRIFAESGESELPPVFSATSIKGQEYRSVALYKFGEAHPAARAEDLDTPIEGQRDFAGEYFFNKMYVGATRATHNLWIIDTREGDERLWQGFSVEKIEEILGSGDGKDIGVSSSADSEFEEVVRFIGLELAHDLHDEISADESPRELADKLREYGIQLRDAGHMRKAKARYRAIGERRLVDECEAYARLFDGDVDGAGELFEQGENYQEAFSAYWASEKWSALARIAPLAKVDGLQNSAVALMAQSDVSVDALSRFADEVRQRLAKGKLPRPMEEGWDKVYKRFATLAQGQKNAPTANRQEWADVLVSLCAHGFTDAAGSAAAIYMALGEFDHAESVSRRYGISLGSADMKRLAEAKGFPDGLKVLLDASLHQEVLDIWETAGKKKDGTWITAVSEAMTVLGRHEELVDLYLELGASKSAAAVFLETVLADGRVDDRQFKIAESFGQQRDFIGGDEFVVALKAKNRHVSRVRLNRSLMIAGTAALEGNGWPKLPTRQAEVYRRVADYIEQLSGSDGDQERDRIGVLALGAIYEVAEKYEAASKHYRRHAASGDVGAKRQVRVRWLVCAKHLDDGSRGRQAQKWGISLKGLPQHPSLRIATEETETSGVSGALQWEVDVEKMSLRIEIDTEDSFEAIKVDLDAKCAKLPGRGKVEAVEDVLDLEISGRLVQVTFGNTIELSLPPAESRHIIYVDRSSGDGPRRAAESRRGSDRTAANRRVTPPKERASIQAYKLATELGTDLAEIKTVASSHRFLVRSGTARIPPDVAAKIRRTIEEKGKDASE